MKIRRPRAAAPFYETWQNKNMATILLQDGFRFFIPSLDHHPPHIHVANADGQAKFNLEPVVEIVKAKRMKLKDLNAAFIIVCQNREPFLEAFHKFHPIKK